MTKIILFVDDAPYALANLRQRLVENGVAPVAPLQWIVVGCAPRMTHRVSKWVSHSARENWRAKWFARLQEQVLPALVQGGETALALLAKGPLSELTRQLKLTHGAATVVLDMRRPRLGARLEPLTGDAEQKNADARKGGWAIPRNTPLGLGALFLLAQALSD